MRNRSNDLIEIADWLSNRSGIFDCDCDAYMESDTGAWIHDENTCAVFWQDHIDITLRESSTTIIDLLTACEAALDWLNRFGKHAPIVFGGEDELSERIRAAIAKARGEA